MTDQQPVPPAQFAPAPSVESLLGADLSGRVTFPVPPQAAPAPASAPVAEAVAEAVADVVAESVAQSAPVADAAGEPVEPIVTELGVATDHGVPFLQMTVEAVAASLITKLHTAEAAAREHLAAMEQEAARRCELLTAQAELDAELIRLYARRESHAILAAARATIAPASQSASESAERNAEAEAGLEAVGEAVLRGVEALDQHLQRLRTAEGRPSTESPA